MRYWRLMSTIFIMAIALNIQALKLADVILKVSGGYNLAQQYGTSKQAENYEVETGFFHGITTGLTIELPLTPDFSFAYDFNYVTKGSSEKIKISQLEGEALVKPAIMDVNYRLDYLEFPMLLKVKTLKSDNFCLSLTAGAAMALKVNGDYRLKGTVYFPEADSFTAFHITDKSKLKNINQFDYSLIYGGEMDFSLAGQPLTLGYRFTIGWDYISLPTYDSGGFDPVQLRNQSYALYLSTPIFTHKNRR